MGVSLLRTAQSLLTGRTIMNELLLLCQIVKINTFYLSRDMRFPTMWYVRPATPQISLRIRAV